MVVYVAKNFFAMLRREYCVKVACNVEAHDLDIHKWQINIGQLCNSWS